MAQLLMRLYVALAMAAMLAGLGYVYVDPPGSLRVTREGVPHFAPPVIHPQTGEAIPLQRLVQHYKGERR